MASFDELRRIISRYGLISDEELDDLLDKCPQGADPVEYLKLCGVLNDKQAVLVAKRLEVEAARPAPQPQARPAKPVEEEEEELEPFDPSEAAAMVKRPEKPLPRGRRGKNRRMRLPEPEPIVEDIPEPMPLPDDIELEGLKFGEILVKLGLVADTALTAALARQEELRRSEKPQMLGEILLTDDKVTEAEILQVLKLQGKKMLRCMSCDLHANDTEKVNAGRAICPACFGRLIEKPTNEPFPAYSYNLINLDTEPADPLLGAEFKDFLVLMPYMRTMSSTIYQGQQTSLGRKVGIQVLCRELAQKVEWSDLFVESARRAARLSFHNIAAGLDVGEIRSRPCYVFEFPEGHSLEDFVIKKGVLGAKVAAKIGFQIAQTLEYCHKQNIYLGAINPAQIFISSGYSMKMIGPGMNLPGTTTGGVELPSTNPAFVAPEVLAGSEPDVFSDMFSLGCLLYYAVTGTSPVRGRNWLDLAACQIHYDATPASSINPEVGREMENILARLLAKDPDDRYADAEQMLKALATLAGENYAMPIDLDAAEVPKPLDRPRRKMRRRRRY